MRKDSLNIYKDGAKVRINNKKIILHEVGDGFMINMAYATHDASTPAVSHKCVKGKVRVSQIKLSQEAIEHLMNAYVEYKKSKMK